MKDKLKLHKNWSTHNTVLIDVLENSTGDVLEVGSGPFSTPLLHWICKKMNRRLLTYENFKYYFDFAKTFTSKNHRIRFVEDWDKIDIKTRYGVVFLDHAPQERRGIDALRFKDVADYIVMHDTETDKCFKVEDIVKQFKYSYTWKECRPWTTILSNTKDLSNLKKMYEKI
jgi:hypothetical protein